MLEKTGVYGQRLQTRVKMVPNDTNDPFRLDPNTFPKRIELELPEEVIEAIERIAEATGRSFSEVATDIFSQACNAEGKPR